MPTNLYATDGKCHNANAGTYGHECGKPAEWIGHKADGFASGFCSRCKEHGDEARPIVRWETIEGHQAVLLIAGNMKLARQLSNAGRRAKRRLR